MGDAMRSKACILWVGGSIPEMEAVRNNVGKHNAEFIQLVNNTETRRWLHTHEDRIPMTSIVTNRFRADDGGDLAAENLITLLRGLTSWNSIRVMVFCARTDALQHLQSNLTRLTTEIGDVITFVLEHSRTAGVGLTTTFRSVSDGHELESRVRQVETYVRVLRKLVSDVRSDLDEETLQDLRRRSIASKASMLRWLTTHPSHPDVPRIEATIRSIEDAENAYATAVAERGGSNVCPLYFRVRERPLIPGVENASVITNPKHRKVMLLVDKNRWAVYTKDGKDLLGSQKYEDTVELRIGRSEIATVWRHSGDGKIYAWCIGGTEQEMPTLAGELWRRIQHYRLGMTLRCVGSLLDISNDESSKTIFHLMLEKTLRILPYTSVCVRDYVAHFTPLQGSSRAGSGVVRTVIELSDNRARVSDPMVGESLRSFKVALSSAVLRNRFEVHEKAKYVFETDSEVQTAMWVSVLKVSTGQAVISDVKNKANAAALNTIAVRAKSPPRRPSPATVIEAPAARTELPVERVARADSLPSVPSNTRTQSPPKRAIATIHGLPAAILARAKSPPRLVPQVRSVTPPTTPVARALAPTVSAPLIEPPKAPSPKRAPVAEPPAVRTILPVVPPAEVAPAPMAAEPPRKASAQFGDTIVSLLTVNLRPMQNFHERLSPSPYRSALLQAILDLEELQFHLNPLSSNLPALIQALTQQLERPEWATMLASYFTAECPSGFVKAESEEYLRIFRLFSRLQEIVKTDLDSTQELRMRKQMLLNQVTALLKGVNAMLPPLQPAGFTRPQSPVRRAPAPTQPATPPPSPVRVQTVQALWQWTGAGPSESSIAQGEILVLKAQPSAEWWFVQGAAGEGYVPASYLRLLP